MLVLIQIWIYKIDKLFPYCQKSYAKKLYKLAILVIYCYIEYTKKINTSHISE